MVNVYLFIELLRSAKATDIAEKLKALELGDCKLANVVVLADDKLVAQLTHRLRRGLTRRAPVSACAGEVAALADGLTPQACADTS